MDVETANGEIGAGDDAAAFADGAADSDHVEVALFHLRLEEECIEHNFSHIVDVAFDGLTAAKGVSEEVRGEEEEGGEGDGGGEGENARQHTWRALKTAPVRSGPALFRPAVGAACTSNALEDKFFHLCNLSAQSSFLPSKVKSVTGGRQKT